MKVKFLLSANAVVVVREADDKKIYRGGGWGDGHGWEAEHALMHRLKKFLNQRGFLLIKERMQNDGHMYGQEATPYLRPPKRQTVQQRKSPQIYIYDGEYALRQSHEDWNRGEVRFLISNAYEPGHKWFQTDWKQRIQNLCGQNDDLVWS